MEDRYTIFFQKGSGHPLDSFTEWGIVCCQVPFRAGGKTKALEATSLPDEHGEMVAFPKNLIFEPYDAEFVFAYKGEELATNPFNLHLAFEKISAFKRWLSGNDTDGGSGTELKIYSPFATIGRQGCYLLEISEEDPVVQTKQSGGNLYNENVVTFKVTFRVTDPMTDIVLEHYSPYSGDLTGSVPELPAVLDYGDIMALTTSVDPSYDIPVGTAIATVKAEINGTTYESTGIITSVGSTDFEAQCTIEMSGAGTVLLGTILSSYGTTTFRVDYQGDVTIEEMYLIVR